MASSLAVCWIKIRNRALQVLQVRHLTTCSYVPKNMCNCVTPERLRGSENVTRASARDHGESQMGEISIFLCTIPLKQCKINLHRNPTQNPPLPPLSPPPPHSQGLSVPTRAERLGVSAGHTPQLCTWNCSHSRLAVNPHTCSHLRPAPLRSPPPHLPLFHPSSPEANASGAGPTPPHQKKSEKSV